MESASKVTGILDALSTLEENLDSLESSVGDMKKSMISKTQSEIESVTEKVRQSASLKAQKIIQDAKAKAESESESISKDGKTKLEKIRTRIESESDGAVDYVVSAVLTQDSA